MPGQTPCALSLVVAVGIAACATPQRAVTFRNDLGTPVALVIERVTIAGCDSAATFQVGGVSRHEERLLKDAVYREAASDACLIVGWTAKDDRDGRTLCEGAIDLTGNQGVRRSADVVLDERSCGSGD